MKGKHTSLNFLFIFISTFLLLFSSTKASEIIWQDLSKGDRIILIRHSIAPGGGDPVGFNLQDCKTQRNLSKEGIDQSKRIGEIFKKKNIPIDQVLSSEWCRCKDTAHFAFQNFKTFSALNSTFSAPYNKNQDKQIKDLKMFVNQWNSNKKNLVLITHYSIITAITDAVPSSGEIVVTDKNFRVIGTIRTD